MSGKLHLDPATVARARALAREAGRPIVDLATRHTTVSVERATLRLAGLGGRRPRGHALGEPAHRRGPRGPRRPRRPRARPRARRRAARLGRAAARRGRRPADPGPEGVGRVRDLPDARGRRRGRRARRRPGAGRHRHRADGRPARRAGGDDPHPRRRPAQAVDLPDRRHRGHLRGHPAGAAGRPRGRRRHRGDPLDRPEPARLRARGRHPRGLRRHLRHAGELPPDARGAGRVQQGARPLRPADQLRLRAVHAGDRGAGRHGAPRHDAQRLDVRDPVPRHQPGAHLRRPAVQPPGARPRRDHHQHRRGQLPHHRGRRRGGAHGDDQPAAQRVLRARGGPRGLADRAGPRLRDRPGRAGLLPDGAGPRAAGPRAVPRRAAEVDAAHPAHDRRRVPRLPARRLLQPRRGAHRPGHPARRHDDGGRGDPLALRPRPGAAERPLRPRRRRPAARGLPPRAGRLHRRSRPRGAGGDHRPARPGSSATGTPPGTRPCWRPSPTAPSG